MGFFDAVDSRISNVITGISNAFHPSLSWQTGYVAENPGAANDQFLSEQQKQQKNQSGALLIGAAVLLLLILKKK